MSRIKAKVIGLFLALSVLSGLLYPPTASADPYPCAGCLRIASAYAYQGVLETSDILVVAHYQLDYPSTTVLTTPADSAYGFKFMMGSVELGAATPYVFIHSDGDATQDNGELGYGDGVVSFYWTASQVSSLGIIWASTVYTIRIEGDPGFFSGGKPSIPYSQITWKPVATSLTSLSLDIINDLATKLQTAWGIPLTQVVQGLGTVLSSSNTPTTLTGAGYFENVIPGLRSMVPNIFPAGTQVPSMPQRAFTQSQGTTFANALSGTYWDNAMVNTASLLNMPKMLFTTMLFGAIGLVAMFWVAGKTGGRTDIGAIVLALCLLGGLQLGGVPLQLMLLAAFLFGAAGFVWVFFINRSS